MDGDAAWPDTRRVQPVHFGAACFDPSALRLTINGETVSLEQRPMALLSLLLARRGEVVAKERIMAALWPGRTVTEASLTKCVGRLRAALGDTDHTIIHTVHGYGYRFDAALTGPASQLDAAAAPRPAAPAAPQAAAEPPQGPQAAADQPQDNPRMPARTWRLALLGGALLACLAASLWFAAPHHRSLPSAQARALYMSGLQDWTQRTPAALTRAIEEFTAALRLSPDYADAYVGLASCYNLLPEYAAMPAAQAYPLARDAAARAIALQPNLAAAHAAHAFALFWGDWNFTAALAEYESALRLAPENATIHHWYATALDDYGAHAKALAQIDRALELDPASPSIQADRGLLLFNSGRAAEARAVLTAMETRAPDFLPAHNYLADIAHATGDDAAYLREQSIYLRLKQDTARGAVMQAAQKGLAAGGAPGMRHAILDAQLTVYADGYAAAADVARAYAAVGEKHKALAYLGLAIDRHDWSVISILNDPEWRAYLADAEMAPLLARLGLRARG